MKVILLDDVPAAAVAQRLGQGAGHVVSVRSRVVTEPPPPPYTTATLLQDATARLGWSSQQVMEIAQSLFEEGLITYPRTDSTHVAPHAAQAARQITQQHYGISRRASWWKRHKSKARPGAHEAIRPTDPRKTPDLVDTTPQAQALYRLIWQRFLASYMPPAKIRIVEVEVEL